MDSRDWLTASEPRSVRPVFKRILEEITRVDSHAAELYEEGSRKEQRSSESSSRRTHLRYCNFLTSDLKKSNVNKIVLFVQFC
jgi:hypothetical protein